MRRKTLYAISVLAITAAIVLLTSCLETNNRDGGPISSPYELVQLLNERGIQCLDPATIDDNGTTVECFTRTGPLFVTAGVEIDLPPEVESDMYPIVQGDNWYVLCGWAPEFAHQVQQALGGELKYLSS